MDYIKGEDREQLRCISYDQEVSQTHLVRVVDAFVDKLDLIKFNFTYAQPTKLGRKSYNPSLMLKLYIYGYMDGIRSSRKLEKATNETIPYKWLMHGLQPDFKTIADFRKHNILNIRSIFLVFNRFCITNNLIDFEMLAVDGTYIEAVNHNLNNVTLNKVNEILRKVKQEYDRIHAKYYNKDKSQEWGINEIPDDLPFDEYFVKKEKDKERLVELADRQEKYEKLAQTMKDKGVTQLSKTDPDSKMMQKTGSKRDCSFNCQSVVDKKNGIILEIEACSDSNDSKLLYKMSNKVKSTYRLSEMSIVADKGYGYGSEIKKCNDANIKTYVSIQDTDRIKGTKWATSNFIYDAEFDCFVCPNGRKLPLLYKGKSDRGKEYGGERICKNCPNLKECTRDNKRRYRSITVSLYDDDIKRQKVINTQNQEIINSRKSIVEHPFGTIKRAMNQGYFLTKGLESVNSEFTYTALAYNFKRVFNILGFDKFMASIKAFFRSSPSKRSHFSLFLSFSAKTGTNFPSLSFKMVA